MPLFPAAQVWSPRRNVELLAVPEPNLAVAIVPVVIFEASRLGMVLADKVIVLFESEIVLFVKVSVVARPTKVSVAVGKVNVPVFEIDEMTGVVKVLFVSVCVPVRVTTVESIEIVPVEVTGPPVKPVPVLT